MARQYAISRWFVYSLIHLLTALLLELSRPFQPGPKPKAQTIPVDKNRLDRAVVTLWVAGCSLEGIQMCLEEILDTPRSIGSISQTIKKAQEKAAAFNREVFYGVEGTGLTELVRNGLWMSCSVINSLFSQPLSPTQQPF